MRAEKRSELVQGLLAGSTLDGEAPKDVETRSKLVLGTLAGLVLGIPASFAVAIATPQALAGPCAALMIAAYIVLKLRSQPPPVAAPRRSWAVFFGAAAATASPFLVSLLVSSWLASLWPILRFSSR